MLHIAGQLRLLDHYDALARPLQGRYTTVKLLRYLEAAKCFKNFTFSLLTAALTHCSTLPV